MKTDNPYLKDESKHFLHTFKRQPLMIKKAKDSYVWDVKGRRYLDLFSGLAVCGVGHNNTSVVKAIQKQAGQLLHTSNYFYTEPQSALARALTQRYKGSRVFFANSGAEANELAIKLTRLWATKETKKKGRTIVTFENSFHGRTLATAAASGGMTRATNSPFAPLPTGFLTVPFNDVVALRKVVNQDTIAVMVELIQGEGGINIASESFVQEIKKLCRKYNALLIIDEIQTGMGRTGTFFAFEQLGLKPDVVTLAKGLAGGLPLSATLAVDRVAKHVVPGLHGSTFGGNPVSCAASLEVLKLLTPNALKSIERAGKYLAARLEIFKAYPSVKEIRGRGLMLAIQLNVNGWPYVSLARERGLLINCTQENVLRFLPPYFMSRREMNEALTILKTVFDDLSERSSM